MKRRLSAVRGAVIMGAIAGMMLTMAPAALGDHVDPERYGRDQAEPRNIHNVNCDDLGLEEVTKYDPVNAGDQDGVSLSVDTENQTVDWASEVPISVVIVKGGPDSNVYFYDPAATSDTGLHPPLNLNTTKDPDDWHDLSHVDFCLGEDDEPEVQAQGSVAVEQGSCDWDAEDGSTTPVTVTIAPDGAATVEISDGDGVVETATGTGGTFTLGPGEYTWEATASEGFTLAGSTSGGFTNEECEPEVLSEVEEKPDPEAEEDDAEEDDAEVLGVVLAKTGPVTPVVLGAGLAFLVLGALMNATARGRIVVQNTWR